jgi:hypothetical protein
VGGFGLLKAPRKVVAAGLDIGEVEELVELFEGGLELVIEVIVEGVGRLLPLAPFDKWSPEPGPIPFGR